MNTYTRKKKTLAIFEDAITKLIKSKTISEYSELFPAHFRLVNELENIQCSIQAIRKVELE